MFVRSICRIPIALQFQRKAVLITEKNTIFRSFSRSNQWNVLKKNEEEIDLMFDLGKGSHIKKAKSLNMNTEKSSTKSIVKNKLPPKQAANSGSSQAPRKIDANSNNSKKTAKLTENREKLFAATKNSNKSPIIFAEPKYFDSSLNLSYVKFVRDDPRLATLMLMMKSHKYRDQKQLLLIEGRRLTIEALQAGLSLEYLLFSKPDQMELIKNELTGSLSNKTTIIRVPHNDLSFWSTMTTCPGLISVFRKPADMTEVWSKARQLPHSLKEMNSDGAENKEETAELDDDWEQPQITVICDQIREPNNLGSVIRTCAAIPCTKVIMLKGCADPWDTKALRGGCGAHFRIPIVGPIEWESVQSHLPTMQDISIFIADNKSKSAIGDDVEVHFDDYENTRKHQNEKHFKPKSYTDVPFHLCKHVVLVIGGETEGVSSHALDFMTFASKNSPLSSNSTSVTPPQNSCIQIPLSNGVESLNANAATAILLFEIRKKIAGY